MNQENPFIKDLDKLIALFKKFREKTMDEHIPGFDKQFFQSFDMIVDNYEMIKNQLPDDYFKQMGEPLRKMIRDMINQLQQELGEEIETKNEIASTIKEIDDLLKGPDLSSNEIDDLLDKRTALKSDTNNPSALNAE